MRIARQAKSSCDVKIGNLQGLKAGSDLLLDNFLMHATQDCRSGHRYYTMGFL